MDYQRVDMEYAERDYGAGDELPIYVKTVGKSEDFELDCGPCNRCIGLSSCKTPRGVWFIKDVCGIFAASFTWFLVIYAEFVMIFCIILSSEMTFFKFINVAIFHFFSFMAIVSHLRTMLSDPGAIPKGNATLENIRRLGYTAGHTVIRCAKCACIKLPRAHHCSICQRCIRKMDHHCPWVNNCVGEHNQKFFVLFTIYIFLLSIHGIIFATFHIYQCSSNDWNGCTWFSPANTLILFIFYYFEGALFGLFTIIMACSQICAIAYDETGIENLKKEIPTWQKQSFLLSMKTVFGLEPGLKWFSPFHSPLGRPSTQSIFYNAYDV